MSTSPGSPKPENAAKSQGSSLGNKTSAKDPWEVDAEAEEDQPAGSSKKWVGLGVAVGLNILAFGILGYAAYRIFGSHGEENKQLADLPTLPAGGAGGVRMPGMGTMSLPDHDPVFYIIKDPAKRRDHDEHGSKEARVFSSISEGLSFCPAGAVLQIRDQSVYEEQIVHGRGSSRASAVNVRIVAEKGPDGRTAVLRLPKDAPPGTPLVQLDRAVGFTIRGMTLDGQNRCDDLITMSGNCAGALFEDLQLQGFQRSAVKLVNCWGRDEHDEVVPLRLRDLRIEAPAAGAGTNDSSGVILHSDNQHVIVQRCRFLGPFAAAIRLEGSAQRCQFDHNVFFGGQRAIVFGREAAGSQAGKPATIDLKLNSNTFCRYTNALVFNQPLDVRSAMVLSNNLFCQIGKGIGAATAPVTVEQLAETVQGEANVRDPKSPIGLSGVPRLQAAEMAFDLPENQEQSLSWLRYSLRSPLARAGQNGTYVGALTPLIKE